MLRWFRKVKTPNTDDELYARVAEIEKSIIRKFGSERNFALAFIRGMPITKDEEWYAENWVSLNAALAFAVGEILNTLQAAANEGVDDNH